MGQDLCFEFSRCNTFCSLLTGTSISVAIFVFSPSNWILWSFAFASVYRASPSFFHHKFPISYHLGFSQAPNSYQRLPIYQKTHTESTLSRTVQPAHCKTRCSNLLLLLVLSKNTFGFLSLMSCLSNHVAKLSACVTFSFNWAFSSIPCIGFQSGSLFRVLFFGRLRWPLLNRVLSMPLACATASIP